jgi:hypothetical protein
MGQLTQPGRRILRDRAHKGFEKVSKLRNIVENHPPAVEKHTTSATRKTVNFQNNSLSLSKSIQLPTVRTKQPWLNNC